MTDGASDLQQLSSLLDAYLDLDPAERDAWLDGLTGDAARLRPALSRVLARDARGDLDAFLEELPAVAAASAGAPPSDFHAGDAVGPYRLLYSIGRGGMGEVWLATRSDGHLKRGVALKLPMVGLRRSVLVQRFERERDILAALIHPHIARLYDAGVADDGQPFMALEYVQGTPITQAADDRALDVAGRVRLLRQVMDAVQYAHANLVVHRDLKPANVLVTADGEAKLLDFGIAKLLEEEDGATADSDLTRLGGRALTLRYAAPELIAGGPVTTAVDVWALGVLLYELLAGRRPFGGGAATGVEQEILYREPTRPSQGTGGVLSRQSRSRAADLDTIVLKALKKDAAARYATVGGFADDLDRWLRGEPVLAQPDRWGYRLRLFVGRHRFAAAATTLASVALIATAAVALVQGQRAREESARALAARDFMVDLFGQTDPDHSRGQEVSAKQLLLKGRQNIVTTLRDQPLLQAELLYSIGLALDNMYDLAASDAAYADAAERFQRLGRRREAATITVDRAALRLGSEWQAAEATRLLDEARTGYPGHAGDAEFLARHAAFRTIAANMEGDLAARAIWYAQARQHAAVGFREPTARTVFAVRLLALAEGAMGQVEPAAKRLAELLDRVKDTPGSTSPLAMTVLVDLGAAERRAGRFQAALQHHDEADGLCHTTLDAKGIMCVYNQFHRSALLMLLGQDRAAMASVPLLLPPPGPAQSGWAARRIVQAFEIVERNGELGMHPELASRLAAVAEARPGDVEDWQSQLLALTALARQLLREGQAERAQELAARAHALIAARGQGNNRFVLPTQVLHALTWHALGEHAVALQALDRACARQRDALNADHPVTVLVCVTRARPMWALQQTEEALTLVDNALPILRRTMGDAAPTVQRLEALRAEIAGPPPATAAQRRAVAPFL